MPGSARRRLLDAALEVFERDGFEAAGVVDIATTAGVTTGSLYHHFGSKLGLFTVIRREMERRVRDRFEGAAAVAGGGRQGVAVALLVGFDAAVRFKAARILSDDPPEVDESTLRATLGSTLRSTLAQLAAPAADATAAVLLGAWRSALSEAARGDPATARAGLAWALGVDAGGSQPAPRT